MATRRVLLCVVPYVPWSGIDHAGGSYDYHYLTEFDRLGWTVRLAAPFTHENEAAREHLATSDPSIEVTLFEVPEPSRRSTMLTLLLAGRDGVSPAKWVGSDRLAEMARHADVVDLQWHDTYGYASWFAKAAPHTPLVALAVDLRSQSAARNAAAARGPKRLALRFAARRVQARERKEINHCTRLFAFKTSDLERARSRGVRTPGLLAPPYVELPLDDVSPDASSRTMVFPAAFHRAENAEAAHWFLDAVWPLVRAEVPDARLRLAGARPPKDLLARASDDVVITGYLESFLDGYRAALLSVAPLRRGAGLKFKVVQSMALGFPTVGTSVAMEGIEDFLLSDAYAEYDEPGAFAAQVVAILKDPQPALAEAAVRALELREKTSFSRAMAALSDEFTALATPGR